MRLLIISDMPHYKSNEDITGWGPTMEEINHLPSLFDEIVHIAFLYPGEPPASSAVVKSGEIRFVPLEPSGGDSIFGKLDVIFHLRQYYRAIQKEICKTDAVFIRCPSNVGLLTICFLAFKRNPVYRWVKYAGNWQPKGKENISYRFQRWWLNKGLHKGAVTVNGSWPEQRKHVFSFLNPSFDANNLTNIASSILNKQITQPIHLLFVGRCEAAKGVGRIIEIAHQLKSQGIRFTLDIIGDGPERSIFERDVVTSPLKSDVHFHGWLTKDQLSKYYQRAHLLLLPTTASEGWPKVLSEGMAYGVVPLVGAISSIPEILQVCKTGAALDPLNVDPFVSQIKLYLQNPDKWKQESLAGVNSASMFTYDHYLFSIKSMFRRCWGVDLPSISGTQND